jgi:hypothetical protein
MFCPNCGADNADNNMFCGNCGAALNKNNAGQQEVKGFDPNAAVEQPYMQNAQAYAQPAEQPYAQPVQYNQYGQYNAYAKPQDNTINTVIKVFMIISCVFGACFYLLPLAWRVPMTVHAFKKLDAGEPISTGFKVCTLLFVGLIPGILLLVRND